MEKILGIDLGTNSIGWAIRDIRIEGNQIIDKGVLTFEKGVGEGKSGEFPLVQKRTESRGKRRNYQAEKYRKWALLETLIDWGMCPLTVQELDEWRKYRKGFGRNYPQSREFIYWLRFDFNGDGKPDFEQAGFSKHENHFLFRWLAASEDEDHKALFQTNPLLLGRVFYQLVQRRGFRGRDEDGEEAKAIVNGSEKTGTIGVKAVEPYLERYNTLGSALYHLQKEQGGRIRKRYNLRTDYEHELKEICRIQGIDESKYKALWKAIIWQRPLRSQKGLVGICTFERNKARVAISHPLYEEFRTWVFINNLKIELPEGIDKQEYLYEYIYPLFYRAGRDFKLEVIIKELAKVNGCLKSKFDKKEKGENKTKVIACALLYKFEKWFGKDWKNKLGWHEALSNQPKPSTCTYSFEDIWHVLNTFDSKEKLKEFALEKLGFDEEQAIDFSKFGLQQGYGTLSLSAIKKILPYLQQGYLYSHAVYLANMHKVLGEKHLTLEIAQTISSVIKDIMEEDRNEKLISGIINSLIRDELNEDHRHGMHANYQLDENDREVILSKIASTIGYKTWNEFDRERKSKINVLVSEGYLDFLRKPITTDKGRLFYKSARLHDKLFVHLQDAYGITKEHKKYLWHPSEQESYKPAEEKNDIKILGDPQPISRGFKNPMALKSLHKLKNLLNYLLQEKKIDEDTRVVVEIARELNDTNKRKAIEKWQADNEKENNRIRERLIEMVEQTGLNIDPHKKENIEKYKLWEEQNHLCLYTGKTIQCTDLFKGNLFDFEHTIPATMSFDNELKNLTISDSTYNRQIKGKRIPFELPNYEFDSVIDGVKYSAIKPRIKFIEEKVGHLERELDKQRFFAKVSQTKERKDEAIQKRHVLQFQYDYWRKKLETFTCKEYKAAWRNSQLRDTQIITKYALPYLKTVFKRVDVQKGSVTAAFREIYAVQPRLEKKDRSKHSHHAIDAAVLTLIPSPSKREKILEKYNELKEVSYNQTYHEEPEYWEGFRASQILAIENDVLINFQAQNRTLTPTYKKVRKRGKVEFVKEKIEENKWKYKLNDLGEKIPLVADGASIRGQLHGETFFGAVKLPKRNEAGKIQFDSAGKMVQEEDAILVTRKPLIYKKTSASPGFKSLEDIEKAIVNKELFAIIKAQVVGRSFEEALNEGIWMLDKNGKQVNQIKRIRCKVAAGVGFLKTQTALEVKKHVFPSKFPYKQMVYAQSDDNALCLFYEGESRGSIKRAFRTVDRFMLSTLNIGNFKEIENTPYFKTFGDSQIPLVTILSVGTKVIFYDPKKESISTLKETDISVLFKRLYRIYKFNDPAPSTVYVYCQHHMEARGNDDLEKVEKDIDFAKYQPRLFCSASKFSCAIENLHFKILIDGSINWL